MSEKKGKIITITSSKGGVGKSVFLINLAGVYESLGKKVLLLDLDLSGGCLALSLNVPVKRTIYNAVDDLMYHRFLEIKDYISSYSNKIDCMSCPKDPREANKIEMRYLEILLEMVSGHYDVILIDTTHGFTRENITVFDKSDMILYMVTNDLVDLKNTKNFMSIMKDVEMDTIRVILNNSLHKEEYFNHFDIRTMIKSNIDYTLSENLYIKNITKAMLEGKIITIGKTRKKYKKEEKKLVVMAKDFIGEE